MAIPIVSEIWDGIRWFIAQFLYKMPKPLGILMFLLFLLVFGSILNVFFQFAGVHCNTDKQVMKVSTLNIIDNVRLWNTANSVIKGDILEFEEVHPDLTPSDCYYYAKEVDTNEYEECNNLTNTTGCRYLYKEGNCYNCTNEDIYFDTFFFVTEWHDVCVSDVYHTNKSLVDRAACSYECDIPRYYKFNWTTGNYVCLDKDKCGDNATAQLYRIDMLLRDSNAQLMYNEQQQGNINQILRFKCDNNLKPDLTLYGLNVFNYRFWVLLIVIYIMIIGYLYIREAQK